MDNGGERRDIKQAVMDYLANRMITNIHRRGNCSVVSMQRLPMTCSEGLSRRTSSRGIRSTGISKN